MSAKAPHCIGLVRDAPASRPRDAISFDVDEAKPDQLLPLRAAPCPRPPCVSSRYGASQGYLEATKQLSLVNTFGNCLLLEFHPYQLALSVGSAMFAAIVWIVMSGRGKASKVLTSLAEPVEEPVANPDLLGRDEEIPPSASRRRGS
jgi:hypothetical protein